MPIVSTGFVFKRQQRNGTWLCQEFHVDNLGTHHTRITRSPSSAAADAKLAARDLTDDLQDEEEEKVFHFVLSGGGDPEAAPRNELTLAQVRRRILRRFARRRLEDIPTQEFNCLVAPWVAAMTAQQISTRLGGIPMPRANKIRDRAIRLRDVLCPALALDNGDLDDG